MGGTPQVSEGYQGITLPLLLQLLELSLFLMGLDCYNQIPLLINSETQQVVGNSGHPLGLACLAGCTAHLLVLRSVGVQSELA